MLQTGFLKDLEAAGWTRESVESNGESAVITGDLMHHPCQMARTDWRSGFDDDGDTAEKARQAFLAEMADGPVLVIGTHFATPAGGHVKRDGDGYRLDVGWARRNLLPLPLFYLQTASEEQGEQEMRGILLWAVGVPIPIIILIYLLF